MKEEHRRGVRRLALVGWVAGISILANLGLEIVVTRYPQLGLARLVSYAHKGKS